MQYILSEEEYNRLKECENNEWINNVLPTQLEYFRKEMINLINREIYDTRK